MGCQMVFKKSRKSLKFQLHLEVTMGAAEGGYRYIKGQEFQWLKYIKG